MATIFWLTVEGKLNHSITITYEDSEEFQSDCFIQQFGCTCNGEEDLWNIIREYYRNEGDLDYTEVLFKYKISVIDFDDLKEEIYEDQEVKDALIGSPLELGLWYKTGKGFYFEGDLKEGGKKSEVGP